MKIAVNCWVLRNKNLDGIGYFTVNTISRMIKDHPEVEFQILCDKKFTEDYFDFPNAKKYPIFPALRHPLLYIYYMEFVVSFFLRRHKPDIFLSVDGFLSLMSNCKQIPVIHDLNFIHFPEDLKLKNRLYYNFFFKRFAKKATRIATVSQYSKDDIVKQYNVDPSKIDVMHLGVDSSFKKLEQAKVDQIKNELSNGYDYYFFVGSMHPRKNIRRLLQAFELFKKETNSSFKLVLAGAILWKATDIEEIFNSSNYKNDILFTGRVSDELLRDYLAASYALAFVPTFEGFGLPIIEAMQSGVAVITSNITSMPEVAGPAALYIDPFDIQSISQGMIKLYEDKKLRLELIEKGNKRKPLFSWDKTAYMLWYCIVKAPG